MIAPTEFEPGATSETWDGFLRDATGGDSDLAAFLQRAVGYSLTGDYREEVLFFVHGPKNAGKTTFGEAIKTTLGGYAKTADFEVFLRRSFTGGPRNDIADLAGSRLVISCEVDEGKKLAEGLIKWMTGGDTLKARFLFKEAFEFDPTMKLWLVANHAPKIKADDDAIWRRILRIPFEHSVPPDKIDKTLKQKLKEPEAQRAILAWAVEGCLAWQRGGLGIPPVVTRATESLREEMDPLKDFFDDCCIFGDDLWTAAEALRNEYEAHCKENGSNPVRARTWGAALRAKGCERRRRTVGGAQRRGWTGVGLVTIQTDLDRKTDSEAISESSDVYGESRGDFIENGLNRSIGLEDDPVVKAAEDLGGEVTEVITLEDGTEVPF
jgi:putative DNA primase/helicase